MNILPTSGTHGGICEGTDHFKVWERLDCFVVIRSGRFELHLGFEWYCHRVAVCHSKTYQNSLDVLRLINEKCSFF